MTGGTSCSFCAIVAGHQLASIAYEEQRVLAFMTRGPVTPGHLLVIPNAHFATPTNVFSGDRGEHL